MSVYVDDALLEATLRHGRRTLHARWSHLAADSTAELTAFGHRLGLSSSWLQSADTPQEHFDVTASKRAAAIDMGAHPITGQELEALVRSKRAGLAFHLTQLRDNPTAFWARLEQATSPPPRRTDGPRRVQLRRQPAAARDLPAGTVLVTNHSRWANPYPIAARSTAAHQTAVDRFREYLARNPELVDLARPELAGRHLACTCPPDRPCHADVWLDLVNPQEGTAAS